MNFNHIERIVVKGVNELGHERTDIDAVNGQGSRDEEVVRIVHLHAVFVLFDDGHHQVGCTFCGVCNAHHSREHLVAPKFLHRAVSVSIVELLPVTKQHPQMNIFHGSHGH